MDELPQEKVALPDFEALFALIRRPFQSDLGSFPTGLSPETSAFPFFIGTCRCSISDPNPAGEVGRTLALGEE